MKKISFILLIVAGFSSNLFGADPSIYTWGYGEIFYKILQGVTIISQESYLITSAVAVGGLLLMIKNSASGVGSSDMAMAMGKYLFLVTIIVGMFSTQTKRYIVEDEITGQTFIVNNVPIGIGETFSLFTSLEKNLAKAFEIAFATPNSISYNKAGLGFTMSAPINLGTATMVDAFIIRTFNEYMGNCVFSAISANEMSGDVLTMSRNLKIDLKVDGYLTPYYSAANPSGIDVQCQEAWSDLTIALGTKLDDMEQIAADKMMMDATTFSNGMAETTRLMFGVSQNSKDYLFQQTLINMTNNGLKAVALATGGDASALAYAKALSETNQRQTWAVTGILAQQNLPLMKAVMTVLILGSFILLVILSIVYGDLGHIKMGFTLLFAMVLWTPLALLINGMFNIGIERILPSVSNGGLNMININDVSENLKNYLSFLGYLAASIPIFAYSIAKKSEHGFVSLFSGVGAASSSAAGGATNQTSSGNINAGNSRLGSFNATDMYGAHDYKGNNAWGKTTTMSDGAVRTSNIGSSGDAITKTDSAGNGEFTVGADKRVLSAQNTTTGVSVANGISENYNASKNQTEQIGDAFSTSVARNTASTLSAGGQNVDTTTIAKNLGLTHQSGEALNSATNESIQKTLNDMKAGGKDFTFTTENGANLSASSGFSGNFFGFKAGVDGSITASGKTAEGENFTTKISASDADSFTDAFAKNLSEQIQKSDGLSLALANQVQKTNGFGDSDTKSLAENYAKSYQETESLSEQYSIAQKQDKNYSEDVLPKVYNSFIDNAVMGDGTKLSDVREQDSVRAAELAGAMMRDDKYKEEKMEAINHVIGEKLDTSKAQQAKAVIASQQESMENIGKDYKTKENTLTNEVTPAVENAKKNTANVPKNENDINAKEQNIKDDYKTESKELESSSKKSLNQFENNHALGVENKIDEKSKETEAKVEKAKDKTGVATAVTQNPVTKLVTDSQENVLGKNENEKRADAIYRKATGAGLIENGVFSDNLNTEKLNQFSTKELKDLQTWEKNHAGFGLSNKSESMLNTEIAQRDKHGQREDISPAREDAKANTATPRSEHEINAREQGEIRTLKEQSEKMKKEFKTISQAVKESKE
ncbi:MAG: conjugal transfer protein TraG N-terminal domain-containing protein [Sulfurimonas sp.]|jgi:conjugal transfer mating pair stabilization protein TraG